ncbi:DUF6455 family protein [Azospirillum sp. TSO35-2]|uniref:DUF6455 family protein n=1 Tax=Azospirillum sp. TSO35-2 TaxID=716796 RepID=UPI000D61B17C|nr:DUF6455 family protein [Azospirillum sp. TSO35-2]PWC31239.1 hypothetical protein TSO352_31080 [Azospirillum sp. TSO35-2]
MPTHSPTSPEAFSRKGWCATFLDRWRVERALRALQALEPLDRRTVLHDVGLTEGDLDAVAHADHVDCLLPAALALHGIDGDALEAGQPALMQDLVRVCMHCRSTRACSRMLADGTDAAAHGQLCPNAATLETLR